MEWLHSTTLQPTTQNLQSLMFTTTSAETDANLPTGEHRYLFLFCYQKFYIPTVTLLLYLLIPTYASRTWRVWKPWRRRQYVSPKHVYFLLHNFPYHTPNLHSCHRDNHRFRVNAAVLCAFLSCLLTRSKAHGNIGSISLRSKRPKWLVL